MGNRLARKATAAALSANGSGRSAEVRRDFYAVSRGALDVAFYGTPGECIRCGRYSSKLVAGLCPGCRRKGHFLLEALNINSSTKGAPDIVLRPYTWKGEQWLAIYIDGERTALRAGWPAIQWLRNTLDAELINGGEARNPEYFKRLGMQTDPPPLQKPMAGVIRHPHQRDDGTWIVGPSRSEGATWEDAVSGSSDSSSPDGP